MFLPLLEAFLKSFSGRLLSSFIAFRMMSSRLSKWEPFSGLFNFGNNQKSQGATSGE
jgi:hypothetical protein